MSLSSRPNAIPPSPNSPPESGLKRRRLSDNLPQSPISPSFMSVATKSYVSSYGNSHNSDEATSRSTPSSPRGSSSRSQPTSRPTHSLPTPAHSIAGTNSGFDMADDNDQHRDKRQKLVSDRDQEMDHMEVEPIRQATNHDRNDEMDLDGKAKDGEVEGNPRAADLMKNLNEKTLENLQKDMGEAYLLCRSSKTLLNLHQLTSLCTGLLTSCLQKSSLKDPTRTNICLRCMVSMNFYTVSLARIRERVRRSTSSANLTKVKSKVSTWLVGTSR